LNWSYNKTLTTSCRAAHPPEVGDLKGFLEELRAVNADVARELAQLNGDSGNDASE